MLAPDKHTVIKFSVLYLAGLILKEIQRNGIIKYDELKSFAVNSAGSSVGENFEYALSFLFLLDEIKYEQGLDSFITNKLAS